MYRGLLLVLLVLLVENRLSQSSCVDEQTQRSASAESSSFRLARNLLKRYHDIDYDSFVGLMGRRGADPADNIQPQQKREMHDIFVGLMGRRNIEADTERPWRKEYPEPRGLFFNKCRLRSRRGL